MLPSNLLITRKRKGMIMPVFVERTEENLGIAESIINLFSKCIGKRYSLLLDEFQMLEESSAIDYRLIRSLFTLLERRIIMEEPSHDPFLLRRTVFEIASYKPIISERDREMVFERSSAELGISRRELKENLWADEDPIIREFSPITPDELISTYNLSLLQTLLFKADVLEISLSNSNVLSLRNLLRELRFYGLMYDIWRSDDRINLTIDGPISVLKLTKKYGVAMARFIPSLLNVKGWSMRSRILDNKKIFEFQLGEEEFDRYHKKCVEEERIKPAFDSAVEENFYRRFNSLNTKWLLEREPEPLIKGSVVMFPDFCFIGYNRRIFMEIVGFWTREYIEKKMKKLELFPELIVCVNNELRCSPKFRLPSGLKNVIFYKKLIPLNEILNILKKYEAEELDRELKLIDNNFKQPASPIVTVDELCSEMKVSRVAVKRFLQRGVEGYVFTGNLLVSRKLMDEISAKLDKLSGKATYAQALDIIQEFIPSKQEEVFNALGFTVDWRSLNVENSIIRRKANIKNDIMRS